MKRPAAVVHERVCEECVGLSLVNSEEMRECGRSQICEKSKWCWIPQEELKH